MDYKTYGYIALGLLAVYLAVRAAGEYAVKKLIRAEFEHVLTNDEHKAKGRFG